MWKVKWRSLEVDYWCECFFFFPSSRIIIELHKLVNWLLLVGCCCCCTFKSFGWDLMWKFLNYQFNGHFPWTVVMKKKFTNQVDRKKNMIQFRIKYTQSDLQQDRQGYRSFQREISTESWIRNKKNEIWMRYRGEEEKLAIWSKRETERERERNEEWKGITLKTPTSQSVNI